MGKLGFFYHEDYLSHLVPDGHPENIFRLYSVLNSIKSQKFYNIEFIKMIRSTIKVPIVAMGGVGEWIHLVEGVNAGAQSVAAGNIFHFTEHSTKKAKEFMIKSGIEMRPTYFYQLNTSRKVRDILHPISNKQAK